MISQVRNPEKGASQLLSNVGKPGEATYQTSMSSLSPSHPR